MEGNLYICVRIDYVLRPAFVLETDHLYYVLVNRHGTCLTMGMIL